MSTFIKISELDAGTAVLGTDQFAGVQSSATVLITGSQIGAFVAGDATSLTAIAAASQLTTVFQPLAAGIANTVQITGEYMFTEDNELDYTSSFTDGMGAATITFTELPADTVKILAYVELVDTGADPRMEYKRSSGGTALMYIQAGFADGGNNTIKDTHVITTGGNSIYVSHLSADVTSTFRILGYKTGA